MSEEQWERVDDYLTGLLGLQDSALEAAVEAGDRAGLPSIQVSPPLGKFLEIIAVATGARRILEIGTLGGYSTIFLARAVADNGQVTTLEINPEHAEVARTNIDQAGWSDHIDLRIGPALETLEQLYSEGVEPFDMVFIDADKETTAEYFTWAVRLSRKGTVMVVDNVVRHGEVADVDSDDSRVLGMRRFLDEMAADSRVSGTVIQTVGCKGYDGFALAVVTGQPRS